MSVLLQSAKSGVMGLEQGLERGVGAVERGVGAVTGAVTGGVSSVTGVDLGEVLRRALRLIVEGLAVALACYYVMPRSKMSLDGVVMVGLSAAATLAILDTFGGEMGTTVRSGVGFGTGMRLAGAL